MAKRGRPKGSKNTKTKAKQQETKAPEAQAASSSGSAAASVNSGFKKPSADQVVKLVKRLQGLADTAKTASGQVGEAVAKAVENQHFDRTALSIVRRLYKMATSTPERFAITFPHLLAYCDDLKLDELANNARGMDLEDGEDDGEQDDGAEEAADEQPSGGRPGLQVVRGSAAPDSDVPSAPKAEDEAA